MKTKKLISSILSLLIAFLCAVPTFAIEKTDAIGEAIAQPRFVGIATLSVSITRDGNDIIGSAEGAVKSGYTGSIYLYIQKFTNNVWTTVAQGHLSLGNGDFDDLEICAESVEKGSYRVQAKIYSYKNGTYVESSSEFSRTITI